MAIQSSGSMFGGPSTQPVAPEINAGSINRQFPIRQESPIRANVWTLPNVPAECFNPTNSGTPS